MSLPVYLVIPPFTQLNTPYPATAYLKGFLNTRGITSYQRDLGIEVTLSLFCSQGIAELFRRASAFAAPSENIRRIMVMHEAYEQTIDAVILFLQGKNPTLAHLICKRGFLPEASRFEQLDDLKAAFGEMGIQDKAKHLATMYLEDLADFIRETIDPHFGFSRYAERLGRSANSFDELYKALQDPGSYIDELTCTLLDEGIRKHRPGMIAFSVPFPGNLFSAFRCAQWVKRHYPDIITVMGGGFPNTELRSVSDPRVFSFFDFITLDDGEAPLEQLVGLLNGKNAVNELKRTFRAEAGKVMYTDNRQCSDYRQGQLGTPDYSDLFLDKYISVIEITNPMHSLWSDGRWNKLTMAHGCYWGKCTFCDITLPYIKDYEPLTAAVLCNRMEEIILQTGTNGFHFVDEAAPPALMRALATEIIRRKLVVSWWANVRFEKAFTRDLCLLLRASGCIAVSGGLEVASDRLLQMIRKGITVKQVALVNRHFTEAGIMVHAYLMYGFPTQSAQETIDSLEMVRQMFAAGILQSAFWHQFAMTAHSPVGMDPASFGVQKEQTEPGSFANNDIVHTDPSGADHESFSFGLRKSLFNYMHGACLDFPLQKWFDFKVPKTTIPPDYIAQTLEDEQAGVRMNAKVIYTGSLPLAEHTIKTKKGNSWELTVLTFHNRSESIVLRLDREQGNWLVQILPLLSVRNPAIQWSLHEVKQHYQDAGLEDFELFWLNKPVNQLYRFGLLMV